MATVLRIWIEIDAIMAKRSRNSFWIVPCSLLETFEINVAYKSTRGDVSPLSAGPQSSPVKIPLGPITDCSVRVRKDGEKTVSEMVFRNKRNQSVALPDNILNNLLPGVTPFSQKITSLKITKKKLLSLYLSRLIFCEDFIHHREGVHSVDGFQVDDEGECVGRMIAAGGTLKNTSPPAKAPNLSKLKTA